MAYSKLQYISQGKTLSEQEHNIQTALDNGADWVQIRWKNATEAELLSLSAKVVQLCKTYNAVSIINDAVDVAKQTDADGVHLGLDDERIAIARGILGKDKIIGGTANTVIHVQQRIDEGCDYIGLGPFRFTSTKEKLSPILGLEGYQQILQTIQKNNRIVPPIYAIGGIAFSDIAELQQTGIYGVALSGCITQEPQFITKIKHQLQ